MPGPAAGRRYGRGRDGRAKLLDYLNTINATPEQKFESLLLQNMHEYAAPDMIPDKYFTATTAAIQRGDIQNYGRYNPLGLALGLMAIGDARKLSKDSLKPVKKIIKKFDTINMAGVLKYARWWENYYNDRE